MLKNILFLTFGMLFSLNILCQSNLDSSLTQLDQVYINLWLQLEVKSENSPIAFVKDYRDGLVKTENDLTSYILNNKQLKEAINDLLVHSSLLLQIQNDGELNRLRDWCSRNRGLMIYLKTLLYDLDEVYFLMRAYDDYEEIYTTVNDPMMGLLEWSEYEGQFDLFLRSWNLFKENLKKTIDNFDNPNDFKLTLKQVDNCIQEFKESIIHAQQKEMATECNEIKPGMFDLFRLLVGL